MIEYTGNYYRFSDGGPRCYFCETGLDHSFTCALTRLAAHPFIMCAKCAHSYSRLPGKVYHRCDDGCYRPMT